MHGRSQSVRIGEAISAVAPVISGVPQGSVLGSTLFLLYINVKKTVVYTRVNGALHIENCKNYKKVLLLNSTLTLRRCAGG